MKVSVITPSFNSMRFIRETKQSLFAQTESDWEWLVVDDGSTDGTREYLQELAKQDSRVRPIFNATHLRPARARSEAFSRAQGEYICFLDSDDLWLPQKLERQLNFTKNHDRLFSFHSYRRVDEAGTKEGVVQHAKSEIDPRELLWLHGIGILTVMLHRSLVVNTTMPDINPEDLAFWWQIMETHKIKAYGMDEDLARYRVVKSSRSSNKIAMAARVWSFYRMQVQLGYLQSLLNLFRYTFISLRKYRKF